MALTAAISVIGVVAAPAQAASADATMKLCINREVDGGPFTSDAWTVGAPFTGNSTEQPQPEGHKSYVAIYDAGTGAGDFAAVPKYGAYRDTPNHQLIKDGLNGPGGYLDMSDPNLYGGKLWEVDGPKCADVAVDSTHTYYVLLYGPAYDYQGQLQGYKDFKSYYDTRSADWELGYWIGGGYPAGSSFDSAGRYVKTDGTRAYWTGGVGGYFDGRVAPIRPGAGETVRVTPTLKHVSMTFHKTYRDPQGTNPGVGGRLLVAADIAGIAQDPTLRYHTQWDGDDIWPHQPLIAMETDANGDVYNTDLAHSDEWTPIYEYISPDEWADGMRLDSMNYAGNGGRKANVAYVPVTTSLRNDLLGDKLLQDYDRQLLDRIEVGGYFASADVAVWSDGKYAATPVTVTNKTQAPVPAIGTTAVDAADGDHVLPYNGGAITDTVAYRGLTPGAEYTVKGELYEKATGAGTGIVGTATFTPTTADGTVVVKFTVPAGYAGKDLVAFEKLYDTGHVLVAQHTDITDAAQSMRVDTFNSGGPGTVGRTRPVLSTVASAKRVTPGTGLFDRVRIKRFVPGYGATGTARLYGPFTDRASAVCTRANLAGRVSFGPRNGVVRTGTVRVTEPGVYTWVASTSADPRNKAVSHRCGMAAETTLVAKRGYGNPHVEAGFSGIAVLREAARVLGRFLAPAAGSSVTSAGLGLKASAEPVGIRAGAVDLPANVARLGWLDLSAGYGDKIGTTVVAGHVSDLSDRPGAMWRISHAATGKLVGSVVTINSRGHVYRYQVTSAAKYDRDRPLPHRLFTTTGRHRLVLITCTDKVTHPDGSWHYTKNRALTAVPLG